jgi:actin-related protein
MKECKCCKKNKLEEEFTKRTSNSDGLYSYCKECSRKQCKQRHEKNKVYYNKINREYKQKNKEKINESSREYYYKNREKQLIKRKEYREKNREKISLKEAVRRILDVDRFETNRQKHLNWSKFNRERLNEYQREWYKKNKEKRRAHVLLNRAISSGKIMRPNCCSQCNVICKPDGHHEDYSSPLNVIWICRKCHSRKSPRTKILCSF